MIRLFTQHNEWDRRINSGRRGSAVQIAIYSKTLQATRCKITLALLLHAPVPACGFSVTNCGPFHFPMSWLDPRWWRCLDSDGAAISLTPTNRYDNVHRLYCRVTEGQHGRPVYRQSLTVSRVLPCLEVAVVHARTPQGAYHLLIFYYFNNSSIFVHTLRLVSCAIGLTFIVLFIFSTHCCSVKLMSSNNSQKTNCCILTASKL